MLKVRDNPPMTFPQGVCLAEMSGRWYVAHTKARREKALARSLLTGQIPYFLPMVEKVTMIRGRKFKALWPLFGGYVFFSGDSQAGYRAMQTSHVARVLNVVDQSRLLDELSQIERALASKAKLDPFPFARSGCRCRVRCGPLAGLEGVVLRRRNVVRLVLEVEMLGQGASLEIDASLLEPAA